MSDHNRRMVERCIVALLMTAGLAGCAARSQTVRQETVLQQPAGSGAAPVVIERRVETSRSTTTPAEPPRGVLSGVVHFLGEVVAFPFRLIGGLIRALF